MADTTESNFRLKFTRGDVGGRFAALRRRWWFRVLAWLALLAGVGTALLWALFLRDLPSVDALRAYEPPLPTNVRQGDGTPLRSYARERRVELSYDEYPKLMVGAFLSAEDKTFFDHGGVDYPGLVRAAW
jgi:penicillin-binding protein 1A